MDLERQGTVRMNLNAEQKELLAVVKYYNEQVRKGNVRKLVHRLFTVSGGGYEVEQIADMTGISEWHVRDMINTSLTPKPRRSKEFKPKEILNPTYRMAIHVDSESDPIQRVAYDAAKFIDSDLKPGDMFLSTKEMCDKFQITNRTCSLVKRILVSHNWIQPVSEANKRLGYLVK